MATAGYTLAEWEVLKRDLQKQILPLNARELEKTKFGVMYKIKGKLVGPNSKKLKIVRFFHKEGHQGATLSSQ